MKKYLIVYCYHDYFVLYFNNLEECRNYYYTLLNKYRRENNRGDFDIKVYKISEEIEF